MPLSQNKQFVLLRKVLIKHLFIFYHFLCSDYSLNVYNNHELTLGSVTQIAKCLNSRLVVISISVTFTVYVW